MGRLLLILFITAPFFVLAQQPDTVSIIGVGDMMLGTNYPDKSYLAPDDGKNLLDSLKSVLQNADVTFGNLEGTLLDKGGTVKSCADPKVCYAFRSPTHYATYLKDAGFDVVSIANNHIGDFGERGQASTIKTLKKAGLYFAGLQSYPYTTWVQNNIRFGFCAFAPNDGTMNLNDTAAAQKLVAHLDSICDIVIVSFHGGAEGSTHRNVLRTHEIFYEEDRGDVYAFAHAVVDAGADIVFGQGPHVTRALDYYKGRLIAYSLGNFCTYSRFNLKGPNGFAPVLKVFTDKKGQFLYARVYSIKQEGEGGPLPDDTEAAYNELKNLTAADIPEAELLFAGNGLILRSNTGVK